MNLYKWLMMACLFCTGCWRFSLEQGGAGDMLVVEMPFAEGYRSMCTQGTDGAASHRGTATRHDLDFDTPNTQSDPVYAPVSGTLYAHTSSPGTDFGVHANIDVGDGTYVMVGHMEELFVQNGSDVAVGQLIGFEGNSGNSSGDHVHFGRHQGDASQDAIYGPSIDTLSIRAHNRRTGVAQAFAVDDFDCGLPSGAVYESLNQHVRWHPDGSLLKAPADPDVYLLRAGQLRPFLNESVFWSYGLSFDNVALVGDDELSCYGMGNLIDEYRHTNPETVVPVFTAGSESLMMGDLVTETSTSDVYVIGDGVALPIETWDVLLKLGFGDRNIRVVPDGTIANSGLQLGSCAAGMYCIDNALTSSCGVQFPAVPVMPSGTPAPDTGLVQEDTDALPAADTSVLDTDAVPTTDTSRISATPPVDTDLWHPLHTADLVMTWFMPSFTVIDIDMQGTYTSVYGPVEDWSVSVSGTDVGSVTYMRPAVRAGDAIRFSIDYTVDAGFRYAACGAPFNPSMVQGSFTATWNGLQIAPILTQTGSGGCEFSLTLP